MKQICRIIPLLLCVLLALPTVSLAEAVDEDDEDYDLLEIIELGIPTYDNIEWPFGVDIYDINPDMVRLANKHMLLGKDFVPDPLVTMKTRKENKDGTTNGGVRKASSSEMQLQQTCAEALVEMFEAANDQGIKLYLKSAYRSWRTQSYMYANRLEKYGYDDGYVSKPGASDHQTGLGCDVVSYAWRDRGMTGAFGETEEAQWMAAHCAEYGFILRYPADKEDVTEIKYEPWHLRYVGIPVAKYIMDNGLCLEEFHVQLAEAVEKFVAAGGRKTLVDKFTWESAESED